MLERLREEVAATGRALGATGLVPEASGNVSARQGDRVAVTRTGAVLATATAADVSVVDLDGRLLAGEPPTSELLVHLGIYARLRAGAVVHSHAPEAVAAARGADVLDLPGGPVAVACFAPEGSRALAEAVLAALDRTGDAVVMEGHGTVVHATDLAGALRRTLALEQACAALVNAA